MIWARRSMHHRKADQPTIWLGAEGRELVSRLSPHRPTCDEIDHATCYASRARARHFRRRLYRWFHRLWR